MPFLSGQTRTLSRHSRDILGESSSDLQPSETLLSLLSKRQKLGGATGHIAIVDTDQINALLPLPSRYSELYSQPYLIALKNCLVYRTIGVPRT